MSKSISLDKYPSGMLDVLESVCYTGQPCPITYPDKAAAERERFDFYGLVRALKISNHTLKDKVGELVFSLSGEAKNILLITKGKPVKSSFYAEVAEAHRSQHPMAGPTMGELAVKAMLDAEAKSKESQ